MRTRSLTLLAGLSAATAVAASCGGASVAAEAPVPWEIAPATWRDDPAWYDGRAEVAVYDAERVIYGSVRTYAATAYTNKQVMDRVTTTKVEGEPGPDGVEVFKHHWSERAPTERYDYDFSTCTFTRTADLAAFKLTAATQEDCGACFKQVRRDRDRLTWLESVYLPDTGQRAGRFSAAGVQFVDGLTLLLRDFPFERAAAARDPVALTLVPSQRSTGRRPFEPVTHTVTYAGRETLDVPAGALDAHRLRVVERDGEPWYDLWFAADGAAPWLHVLVAYADHEGTRFRLRALERSAYWER